MHAFMHACMRAATYARISIGADIHKNKYMISHMHDVMLSHEVICSLPSGFGVCSVAMVRLVQSRVDSLFKFMHARANEWHARRHGTGGPHHGAIARRANQPAWQLDRTTLLVATEIVAVYHAEPLKMLWLLVAVAFCLVSWRNVEAVGGLAALVEMYDNFDEQRYRVLWLSTTWTGKAYESNKALARLVPESRWPIGAVRFLKRFRTVVGQEVLDELADDPTPQKTELILGTTAQLPTFVNLIVRRLLSFYDDRMYKDDIAEVGPGAAPLLDYLGGSNVDWATFTFDNYTGGAC